MRGQQCASPISRPDEYRLRSDPRQPLSSMNTYMAHQCEGRRVRLTCPIIRTVAEAHTFDRIATESWLQGLGPGGNPLGPCGCHGADCPLAQLPIPSRRLLAGSRIALLRWPQTQLQGYTILLRDIRSSSTGNLPSIYRRRDLAYHAECTISEISSAVDRSCLRPLSLENCGFLQRTVHSF